MVITSGGGSGSQQPAEQVCEFASRQGRAVLGGAPGGEGGDAAGAQQRGPRAGGQGEAGPRPRQRLPPRRDARPPLRARQDHQLRLQNQGWRRPGGLNLRHRIFVQF